ncbi:MAG TPA: pectate lyase [Mycobacteriales bacterium]|nr:pectate lyase [Mycobacteriales bacterium]
MVELPSNSSNSPAARQARGRPRLRRFAAGAAVVVATGLLAAPATAGTGPTTAAAATTAAVVGPALAAWPTKTGDVTVTATIPVSGTLDGRLRRYCCIGNGGQSESQDPMFNLASGATLANVIIGAPAGDGVHCAGPCTLRNVWWEDVGEDAATFRGNSASNTYLVDGGGARGAADKVFQHNGAGTLTIRNFQATTFGKLYRSCGNCSTQTRRNVVITGVVVTTPGSVLAGINSNFGDTARFTNVTIVNDPNRRVVVCQKFIGNNTGAEPPKNGIGPDSTNCFFTASNITYQ